MSLILSGTDGLSDVDGSAATPAIRGTDANTGIFFPAADTIAFAEGGVECARFDSSGNFGLGVTPSAWTNVFKAAQVKQGSISTDSSNNTTFANNCYYDGSNWKYINTAASQQYLQYAGQHIWNTAPSGTAGNAISFTQAMTLDASGNLLVGTTSKLSGGIDGLDINTAGESGITFAKSGTVKNYFYLITNESAFQWQTVSGVAVNIISSTNGVTLTNGATSWASLSDERKKDIIEPITDAATKVSSLRAVIGKYKTEEDGIRRAMLIAQDVQAVLPEAVVENKDGELLLQYTEIIPLLVAAIKEQSALITTLTARITALEAT